MSLYLESVPQFAVYKCAVIKASISQGDLGYELDLQPENVSSHMIPCDGWKQPS